MSSSVRGLDLAKSALAIYERRTAAYPAGISLEDLERELRMAGIEVDGADPRRTLADALNAAQVDRVWERQEGAVWLPGPGISARAEGLSGSALAQALYEFVRV